MLLSYKYQKGGCTEVGVSLFQKEMMSSYARRGLYWILGTLPSDNGLTSTETGCPGK